MQVFVGSQVRAVQFLARYHALKLEAQGFKRHGRSMLTVCKAAYGYSGGRAAVLAAMDAERKQLLGE